MPKDLIFELGTEELPHSSIIEAIEYLKVNLPVVLSDLNIEFDSFELYCGPRRIAIYITTLAECGRSIEKQVKGPSFGVSYDPEGKPTRALMGFLRANAADESEVIIIDTEKGKYVFLKKVEEGRPVSEIVPQALSSLVMSIPFTKTMRWGNGDFKFSRPIRWVLVLYGDELLGVEVGGVRSGRRTFGHRFLSPGPHEVETASDYAGLLGKNFVVVDRGERAEIIRKQVSEIECSHGLKVLLDEDVFDEVVDLVEYPTAVLGSFDANYLRLPEPVLKSAMMSHQRYFPIFDLKGNLLPKFVFVSNGSPDEVDEIRSGNEKVLLARLDDADFFLEEDMRVDFYSLYSQLSGLMFHEKLGSMRDKADRLVEISDKLTTIFNNDLDIGALTMAAQNCKNDLLTSMVREFPDLEGIMGDYYLREQKSETKAARTIFEHYLPRGSSDGLPETNEGAILALADKFDSIVGLIGIGLVPTGSQDPYALRRKANGIVNIIKKFRLSISLLQAFQFAYDAYLAQDKNLKDFKEVAHSALEFVLQRLERSLKEEGRNYELVDAIIYSGHDDLVDLFERLKAAEAFELKEFVELIVRPFERCNNLSRNWTGVEVDKERLNEQVELVLLSTCESVERSVAAMIENGNHVQVLKELVKLKNPIDAFFDGVLVMTDEEEVRAQRLSILKRCVSIYRRFADFEKINPSLYL
ncbi:MAG: glycine--tRNA ligase subunit beta [Actinobacteria bacterium]|nr:glycine--tRNA ligase subunit beta [Actinomycetota bacterium]